MNKNLLVIFVITALITIFSKAQVVWADALPSFNVMNQGITELNVNNQNFGYPVEITPLTISQGIGRPQLYILPSGWSWLCENTGNILNSSPASPIYFNPQNCKLITKMDIVGSIASNGQPIYLNPSTSTYNSTPWKMEYDGPFSLNIINGNRLSALKHGENTNSSLGGYQYQNTVFPNVSVNDCYSGYVNGTYRHCGEAFTSYANLGWANYNPGVGWNKEDWHDEGPVLWPPAPNVYREINGSRGMGSGPYHTTTFLNNDGYMYAYTIASPGTQAGYDQCNVVARSPVSGNLMPGTWKYYYNGGFTSAALPAGFTKENINNFYSTPASPATCILPGTSNIAHIYFNVAKVKNTPYYVGAEESLPRNSWRMGIRISTDLVNWSDIQVLSTAAGWGSGQQFSYPTFYNKDGASSYEIDADEFYIVGNGADAATGYKLYKMKLSLALNYPANLIEPLIRQYYREFLNRNASDADITAHVNYFRQYGCQADMRLFATGSEFSGRKNNSTTVDYVRILYRAILSRDPNSDYWVNAINSGAYSRDAAAEAFITSQEAGGVCVSGKLLPEYMPTPTSTATPIPLTPTLTSTPPLPGDIDHNGKVNISDYNLLVNDFGKSGSPGFLPADIDTNGRVDVYDYNILVGNFGK